MLDKNRYRVYPDRTYLLIYDDVIREVTGQDILDMFRRETYLIQEMDRLQEKYPELFTENDSY